MKGKRPLSAHAQIERLKKEILTSNIMLLFLGVVFLISFFVLNARIDAAQEQIKENELDFLEEMHETAWANGVLLQEIENNADNIDGIVQTMKRSGLFNITVVNDE